MAQPDRQTLSHRDIADGLYCGIGQSRCGRGGSRDHRAIRERSGREPGTSEREPEKRSVPPAGDQAVLHPEVGEPGTASTWDTDHTRPGCSDGAAHGAGTDLRARLRRAELRLSPWYRVQGRAAAGGWNAPRRVRPCRGWRYEE